MESTEYKMGKEAYSDDLEREHNPFKAGTTEHKDWLRGFDHAERHDPFAPHNM